MDEDEDDECLLVLLEIMDELEEVDEDDDLVLVAVEAVVHDNEMIDEIDV